MLLRNLLPTNALLVLLFSLYTINASAQCTLTVDSTQVTNVSCNGLSNGAITVFSHGAQGTTTYSTGGSGSTVLATQTFSTSSTFTTAGNPTTKWYSASGCSSGSMSYLASSGCTGGAVGFTTSGGGGNTTCYLRSPTINATGLTQMVITFDLTNSASLLNDSIAFSIWSNVSSSYYPACFPSCGTLISSVNGVATHSLLLNVARNCQTMTVVLDLTSIPAADRSSLLLYFNPTMNEVNGTAFNLIFDNISITQSAPGQSSNIFSGLGAGSYTVTLTDSAGCTTSTTVTVTQPAVLTAPIGSQANVSCNGLCDGSGTVTPSGGTSPYTHHWNNGSTSATLANLCFGTYVDTVKDANGCLAIATVNITQPTVITAVINSTNATCSTTGSATVTAGGGAGGYTYQWNTVPIQTTATISSLAAGTYSVTVKDANNCTKTASVTITQAAALTANIATSTNVSCHGGSNGSATVSGSGGSAPYQYNWSTVPAQTTATASNLSTGTYSVTVKDNNNCTATANVTIAEPAVLTATVNPRAASANGTCDGADTAHVSGGTVGYTYTWSTAPTQSTVTAINLCAGSYCVTVVDGHGCTVSACGVVTQPTSGCTGLTVTATSTNSTCNGSNNGTVNVTASGGNGNYEYALNAMPFQPSNQFTGLVAVHYTIYVHDSSGCSGTDTLTITQPSVLTATISNHTNATCNGICNGTATVVGGGGTPSYTYSWNNGQTIASPTNLCAGIQVATVKDANNCTATASITVTQPSTLTVSVTTTPVSSVGDSDGTAHSVVSGGTLPYVYSWSDGDTAHNLSNLIAGQYCVTVTDGNTCTASSCDSVGTTIATGGCTLSLDSVQAVNITCNGQSNGSITVFTHGGQGTVTYSTSASTVILPTQGFDSRSSFDNSTNGIDTTKWSSPSGCTFGGMQWDSTTGCNVGSVGFLTSGGGGNTTCFLRSPFVNCTGLSQVTISFDIINSASALGDTITFSVWSNISHRYYPQCLPGCGSVVSSVNGVVTHSLALDVARNCQTNTTVIDLTSIPAAARSSLAFYFNPTLNETNGTFYTLLFDNIKILAPGATQTSNVFANLDTGTYVILIQDSAGCAVTSNPYTITQPGIVVPAVNITGDTLSTGLFGTYQWYRDSLLIPGATGQSYVSNLTGSYYVQVIDTNGCTHASDTTYYRYTGIGSVLVQHTLTVFPNPFSESFTVQLEGTLSEPAQMELLDLYGRKLMERKVSGNITTISTSSLAQGVYMLRLNVDGQWVNKRIIRTAD